MSKWAALWLALLWQLPLLAARASGRAGQWLHRRQRCCLEQERRRRSQLRVPRPRAWYDYDPSNHQVSPADVVYVLRSTDEQFYKIKLVAYYDQAGTAGYPRFQWAKIAAPAKPVKAEDRVEQEPAADSGDDAKSGCYDMKVHKCDCESDAKACETAMGIWTDKCECT